MRFLFGSVFAILLAQPVQAQSFTTQSEVQPILEMTRAHWIGLGTQSGQDLLYFTHLMAYRCGLEAVYMGVNGNEPIIRVLMEPCHHGTRTPNAIRVPPILGFTENALQSVSIRITFPDGQELREEFSRAAMRID